MKITRRDLGVIMILVGVLSIFLVYQMSFTKMQTEVETLQAEQKTLKTQIDELQPIVDNAPFYQSEMERFLSELDEIMEEFPVRILYEDGIMYVVELEEEVNVEVGSFTATESSVVSTIEGIGSLLGHNYALSSASLSFNYTVEDYAAMKEFLNYIYSDDNNKRNITSVSMAFDTETGEINGTISIGMFAMSDGLRQYTEQELPIDNQGVDCVFGEVEESED